MLNSSISRGVPLIVSMVIVTSFLWGTLFFGEYFNSISQALLAIMFIVVGVFLVGSIGSANSLDFKEVNQIRKRLQVLNAA